MFITFTLKYHSCCTLEPSYDVKIQEHPLTKSAVLGHTECTNVSTALKMERVCFSEISVSTCKSYRLEFNKQSGYSCLWHLVSCLLC
jgi:hypothetical protein